MMLSPHGVFKNCSLTKAAIGYEMYFFFLNWGLVIRGGAVLSLEVMSF